MKNKQEIEETKNESYRYTDETNFRFDDAYESVYEYDDDANAYVYLMSYLSADINTTQAIATKVRRVRRAMDAAKSAGIGANAYVYLLS